MQKTFYKIKKREDLETLKKKFPFFFRGCSVEMISKEKFPITVIYSKDIKKVISFRYWEITRKEEFFGCINSFCSFLSKELKK